MLPSRTRHQADAKPSDWSPTNMTTHEVASKPNAVRKPTKPTEANHDLPPSVEGLFGGTDEEALRSSTTSGLAEGDTKIIHGVFADVMDHAAFATLREEIQWQQMFHVGGAVPRLVCCQGEVDERGFVPVYRHPTDDALPMLPYTPTVQKIRRTVEKLVGSPINHALIQLYRSGEDYISEHSDKTLDIARDSKIVNVSLGAERKMRLRTKRDAIVTDGARQTQTIDLPHGSIFIMGLETNRRWLHGIRADKRLPKERPEAAKLFDGMRISLTFRRIRTFLTPDGSGIVGQGATNKKTPQPVINGDAVRYQAMINAFGMENQQSGFVWEEHYGAGFDVLHKHAPQREQESQESQAT